MRNLVVRGGLLAAALATAAVVMAVDAIIAPVDALTFGPRPAADTIVSGDRRKPTPYRRRIRYPSRSALRYRSLSTSRSANRYRPYRSSYRSSRRSAYRPTYRRTYRSARRSRTRVLPTLPATADVWALLRQCESGGRYDANTGNGFYGAYQFSPRTWTNLGFPGLPHEAPPEMQDEAARLLQARSGWGQWPACSRRIGVR